MNTEALAVALRAFCGRQPFRHFLIEFNSGNRLLVTHPEAVAQKGELFVFRGPDRSQRVFHGMGVCQLLDN